MGLNILKLIDVTNEEIFLNVNSIVYYYAVGTYTRIFTSQGTIDLPIDTSQFSVLLLKSEEIK